MKPLCCVYALVMLTLSGCSQPTGLNQQSGTPLDSSVNGKTVAYSLNQSFALDLDVQADAGYQWDCSISNPAVATTDQAPSFRPKNGGPVVPGGATVETFYFRTSAIGQSTITFIEHQSWLTNVPPLVTVEFTVVVR